jgi:hypothetical protein
MSCILVGLTTLKIDPNDMTISDIIWTVSRDFCLIAWHSALLILATREKDKTCISQSNVFSWLIFDIVISLLRLVKNPLQFQANRVMYQNGSNWSNPQDYSGSWISYFSPNYSFCQMRLYTLVDWLTYLSWILGAWAVHLVEGCRFNFIVNAGYYEISFSTLFYVCSIITYILSFGIHRLSNGRCFPGFSIRNSNWPDSCPSIHFDTTQWRQPGETVQEYRARVVETFHNQDAVQVQPNGVHQMSIEDMRLSQNELNQLKTLRYAPLLTSMPSAQTLNPSSSSDEMDSRRVYPEPSQETLRNRQSQIEMTPILTSPTILTIEPQIPTPLLNPDNKTTDDTCALCLEDYEVDDLLRELRCEHRFHSACVDDWLTKTKRTCPVCNADAIAKPTQE